MNFYSNEDKFSRGILLILFIPLALPHLYLNSADNKIYLLVLIVIFVWMLSLDIPKLFILYKSGDAPRRFVLSVSFIAVLNFVASFIINNNNWLLLLLAAVCLAMSFYAKRVYLTYAT